MLKPDASVISVTQAASKGVSRLVRDAEEGNDVVVVRRNRPVAAVVSMQRLAEIAELDPAREHLPDWLVERLRNQVGLPQHSD